MTGSPNGFGFIGQVQIAVDQKIYVSRWNQDYPYQTDPDSYYSLDSLDVINSPNLQGLACNFQRDAVYLNHKPTQIGLPNFISNFTSLTPPIAGNCTTATNQYLSSDVDFKIYPNPLIDKSTIETKLNADHLNIIILDSHGNKFLPTINVTKPKIEITKDALQNGLYLVQLWDDKKLIAVKKLIVH